MSEEKKPVKVTLKLRRPHPKSAMHLQKHVITQEFKEFELSPAEVKELNSPGGVHWFHTPEQLKAEQAEKEKLAKAGQEKKTGKKPPAQA